MNRRLATLALLALAMSSAPAALAAAPSDVRIDVAVVLAGNLSTSTTHGTFALTGALNDGGSESGYGRFAGQGHLKTGEPNSLHSEMTFVGANGTIEVRLSGLFGTLPAALADGAGRWVISDGTGAYADLHGEGSWTATADFRAAIAGTGPPWVAFVLVGSAN
jgi:hypothetical protein